MTPWLSWTIKDLFIHIGYASCIALTVLAFKGQFKSLYQRFLKKDIETLPSELFLFGFAAGFVTFISVYFMLRSNFLVGIIAASTVGIIAPLVMKRILQARFKERFDEGLIDCLAVISTAVKAGIPVPEALKIGSQNAPKEVGTELSLVLKEYRLGISIEEALDNLRKRVKTENTNIAFGAMIIGSRLGGNLPDMLTRIANTIRERNKVKGKLKSLTAQGRMQGIIVSAAPPGLAVMMYLWDPAKYRLLTDTTPGQVLLCLAIFLEILGIVAMRKTMQLEV